MEEELSRFKLLVTVNAEQSPESGAERERIARYIGERILDAWHGTDQASGHAIAEHLVEDIVQVQKEILYREWAVLLLADEVLQYHFEAPEEVLAEASRVVGLEISARAKGKYQSRWGC